MSDAKILVGHAASVLDELPAASVHACVTSPPYYLMREYGVSVTWPEMTYAPMAGSPSMGVPAQRCELGLEDDIHAYVGHLVHVFRALRRVLRPDGTLWLNLGDGWASSGWRSDDRSGFNDRWHGNCAPGKQARTHGQIPKMRVPNGVKRKDLIGVPWRVAFALQADGWWLRSEIIWEKPNAMPDPTRDRVTRAHETIFQFACSETYFHDDHAIREAHEQRPQRRPRGHKRRRTGMLLPEHTWRGSARDEPGVDGHPLGRNSRSVWKISTTPFGDAHFAVMPREVAQRCILASTSGRGVCGACGAPHEYVALRRAWDQAGNDIHVDDAIDVVNVGEKIVTGWKKGCACDAGAPVAATVLDPFSGAATTGIVALQHGRRFIGIETNEDYAAMSRERISKEAAQGLLFTADGTPAPRT